MLTPILRPETEINNNSSTFMQKHSDLTENIPKVKYIEYKSKNANYQCQI